MARFASSTVSTHHQGIHGFPCLGAQLDASGNPGAGVEIKGAGGHYPLTISNAHHRCQHCLLVAPHCPLQLSQHQQAAVPRPQAQVFVQETAVLGNSAAFPAWGNPHPATGLNSPRKGGRQIGKTITRICFMLPGSLPARSSVFGRPIYNQQCGML